MTAHLLKPWNVCPVLLRSHPWALEALVAEVPGISVHGQSAFQTGLPPPGSQGSGWLSASPPTALCGAGCWG